MGSPSDPKVNTKQFQYNLNVYKLDRYLAKKRLLILHSINAIVFYAVCWIGIYKFDKYSN